MIAALKLFARSHEFGVRRRTVFILLAFQICAIAFEGLGVGMLVPVFQYMQSNGDVVQLQAAGPHWKLLADAFAFVGLQPTLGILLIGSFTAIAMRQTFIYLRQSYKARAQLNAVHALRSVLFRRLLIAKTAYHDEAAAGGIVNDLTTEISQATNLPFTVVGIVGSVLLIIFYLGAMLWLTPWLTLASLVVIAVSVLAVRPLFARTQTVSSQLTAANAAVSTFLVERLRSLRLVRLAGMERPELANLIELSDTQRNRQTRLKILGLRIGLMVEPLAVGLGFALVYAGYTIFKLPVELLGLFLFAMVRILPMAKEFLNDTHTAYSQTASVKVVEERMNALDSAREPKGGNREFELLERALVFDRVSFTYLGATAPALAQVSLRIPANGLTAIVGPSGSGKSTLTDLIPRLRDPNQGSICIDDTPLTEFSIRSLRAGISFVPQTPFLFNVTVADHIRYGKPEASEAELQAAADLAGVARFVDRLPKGYNTVCGETGVMLSAGQRQRVDLARALLRGTSILILDEPTSALDAESEEAFHEALVRLHRRGDRTIIVVAHRLHTVMDADLIAVLEQGRVIEAGLHDELVRAGGWYAKAFGKGAVRYAAAGVA